MTDLVLGWAVVGKWPSSREEQSVLAASGRPFNEGQLNKLVAQSSPGNLPSASESGAGALPWVWLSNVRLHDVVYLSIAVSSWSTMTDAFHRAIAYTRYYFLELGEFLATSMTLSDLYATVADEQLPWEENRGAPFSHDERRVRRGTAVQAASPLSTEDAAAAAAHVIEQPVALLGGRQLSLEARLAALDSVISLLPGGALRWLTAACWATGSHRSRLFFADQARPTDLAFSIRGDAPAVSGPVARYRGTVLRLCGKYGHDAVMRHLRGLEAVQAKDFPAIQSSLEEQDLAAAIVDMAQSGRLVPADVRKLAASDKFELTGSEWVLVLRVYLEKATVHDVRQDRNMLAEHWSRSLDLHLTNAVSSGLRKGWHAQDLIVLADLADAVGAPGSFLSGLRASAIEKRSGQGSATVWKCVVHLSSRPHWNTPLATLVADQSDLALLAAEQAKDHGRPNDDFYQALTKTPATMVWPRVGRPFWKCYWPESPEVTGPTPSDINLVQEIDTSAIPRLLSRKDLSADVVLDVFLPYLAQYRAMLERPDWAGPLRGLAGLAPERAARLDFLFYRQKLLPGRVLPQSDEYVVALQRAMDDERISLTGRKDIVADAVRALPGGWVADPSTFRPVMEAIWRLSTAPDGAEPSPPISVIDLLKEELKRRPDLLDGERLRPWADHFRQLNLLPKQRNASLFARLTREASYGVAATALADAVMADRVPKMTVLVAEFLQRWRARPEEWPLFLIALRDQLHRRVHPDPGRFCRQFTEEMANEIDVRVLSSLAYGLADLMHLSAIGLRVIEKRHPESIDAYRREVGDAAKVAASLKPKTSRTGWSLGKNKAKSDDPVEDGQDPGVLSPADRKANP